MKHRDVIGIQFDRHDLPGGYGQIARQASQPGAHLQHTGIWRYLGALNDAIQDAGIGQEILPQSFFGSQAMRFQKRTDVQRWEFYCRNHGMLSGVGGRKYTSTQPDQGT